MSDESISYTIKKKKPEEFTQDCYKMHFIYLVRKIESGEISMETEILLNKLIKEN